MSKRTPLPLCTSLLCLIFSVTAFANKVYVSPHGNDANEGTSAALTSSKGPFKTINRAFSYIKEAKRGAAPEDKFDVVLLPGTYELADKLVIDKSLADGQPLLIEAQQPGTVIISGGRRLGAFKSVPGTDYLTVDTDLPRGFHILWVSDKRAIRARSPDNNDYYVGAVNTRKPVPEKRAFRPSEPDNIENTRSIILPPEARDMLAKQGGNLNGAILKVLHSWTSSAHRIVSFEEKTGAVRIEPESFWPFLRFGPDQRFALENLPGFLNSPGEWWLSTKGELRYKPLAGESIEKMSTVAPQVETLLEISGDKSAPAKNIVFRGVKFSYSAAWTAPFIDSQAALSVPSAIVLKYAQDVTFDQCEFSHLGGYGIWMRAGSRGNKIIKSVFRDMGAGGIRIGEEKPSLDSSDFVQKNQIEDNKITSGGRDFPGAVGIWVGQAAENSISHNEISDMYYTGISIGWTWGFGASASGANIVEDNYIHDLGHKLLSDMGGVYVLGKNKATVIRNNRIENIFSYRQSGSTAWGIYLDEGASDVHVYNNIVLNTTGGGFHLHYGKENIVENNVFAYGKVAQARRSRVADSDLKFERNVLISSSGSAYEGEWDDAGVTSDDNVISMDKSEFSYKKQGISNLKSRGFERNSVLLRDLGGCSGGACKLKSDALKKVGFKPFSLKAAGVRPNATPPWANLQ